MSDTAVNDAAANAAEPTQSEFEHAHLEEIRIVMLALGEEQIDDGREWSSMRGAIERALQRYLAKAPSRRAWVETPGWSCVDVRVDNHGRIVGDGGNGGGERPLSETTMCELLDEVRAEQGGAGDISEVVR